MLPATTSIPVVKFDKIFENCLSLVNVHTLLITRGLLLSGAVLYEVHTNGSQLDVVNSAISQEVGVAFEGVWLLVVYWNSVPTAADSSKVRSDTV